MNKMRHKPIDPPQERPFLGVMFRCCNVYSRVYRNQAKTLYIGHCPRCATRLQVVIGKGGTSNRFFEAT